MRINRLIVLAAMAMTLKGAWAAEIVKTGTCGMQGDNVTWTLYDDGLLTFAGKGEMIGISDSDYPDWRSKVRKIIVNEGITTIGEGVLANNYAESVSLPSTLSSIHFTALWGTPMEKITVASGNTTYDSRNGCNAIIETKTNKLVIGCSTTKIPSDVISIGENAFNRVYFEAIDIPEGVTSIGDCAFYDCYQLQTLYIPKSVKSIGNNAFGATASLTSIEVNEENAYYDSRNGCNALIETATNKLLRAGFSAVIPATVTRIEDNAFSSLDITSIDIPSSVTSIGRHAFEYCRYLESITIPSSVTKIEYQAFSNCQSLKTMVALSVTPRAIDIDLFNTTNCTLYVPEASVEAYKNADGWKEFKEIKPIDRFDLNRDGKVDIADITMLVDYVKSH